ncbi:hypothetical protein ABT352_21140 [Streptosporangium sp. NPDC000563]|uniref:hypothetical protein n=1 Tax=unclassified Streptosporangium TaxID=2632669 RepID=UPI00331C4DFD
MNAERDMTTVPGANAERDADTVANTAVSAAVNTAPGADTDQGVRTGVNAAPGADTDQERAWS